VDAPNASASASGKIFVANSNDAGPGSFREAINQANSDPAITRVLFLGSVPTVALLQTVTFTGPQDLAIDGNQATLDGAATGGTAFRVTGGGDLEVSNLTVRNAPGDGIAVEVPAAATGTIRVSLLKVDLIENDGFGLLVNDQVDPSTQNGVQPNANGSAASVDVSVINTRFIHNGYSVSDRDGLRVNEGGDGDLTITVKHSLAQDNAADGIEVDERGAGDVRVAMFGSKVTGNGSFDPSDLDDGFDIDEYDAGSIIGTIFSSSASDNYEEGLDFNENNAGDLRVDLKLVDASRNGEEGIDYEEDDDFAGGGDLVTTMIGITADENGVAGDGDAGLKVREKGDGNLDAAVDGVHTSNNLIGGIYVREDGVGNLVSSINKATSLNNAGHGIDFDENRFNASDAGNLTATVTNSTSSTNTGAGVRADQQSPGVGTLLLSKVTLNGNTGGTTTGGGVTVTIQP
jgi:hypothetical protein